MITTVYHCIVRWSICSLHYIYAVLKNFTYVNLCMFVYKLERSGMQGNWF
jgi:hypothetical protein